MYTFLSKEIYLYGNYKLIPIRQEDRHAIMLWRNEQLDILRQKEPLTPQQQDKYFETVVKGTFAEENPKQILFSVLWNELLIGYGGLVHINWVEKTSEISFLTETTRALDIILFDNDWTNYLKLLKQIAFGELSFKEIFTYAYDVRPYLYPILERLGFTETQRISKHISIADELRDVVIHTCTPDSLGFRNATKTDCQLYFDWANDEEVRQHSYNQHKIDFEVHEKWFLKRIEDPHFTFLVFENYELIPVGQVRIEKKENELAVIGISIDAKQRGKGYATQILKKAVREYKRLHSSTKIEAFIKETNQASVAAFTKAGFTFVEMVLIENVPSYKLIYS